MRILVVEDEPDLAFALRRGLSAEGFSVDVVGDGIAAVQHARMADYAAILLDLMIPHLDGFKVVQTLRTEGNSTPILVLTAQLSEYAQTDAFELGADDYVTKPFSFAVLVARVRALIRRAAPQATILEVGDLVIDRASRRCRRGETAISLTELEFRLVEMLAEQHGQPVDKAALWDELWAGAERDEPMDPNLIEARISALRRKIDAPFARASLETVRGVGYRLINDGGIRA